MNISRPLAALLAALLCYAPTSEAISLSSSADRGSVEWLVVTVPGYSS